MTAESTSLKSRVSSGVCLRVKMLSAMSISLSDRLITDPHKSVKMVFLVEEDINTMKRAPTQETENSNSSRGMSSFTLSLNRWVRIF